MNVDPGIAWLQHSQRCLDEEPGSLRDPNGDRGDVTHVAAACTVAHRCIWRRMNSHVQNRGRPVFRQKLAGIDVLPVHKRHRMA